MSATVVRTRDRTVVVEVEVQCHETCLLNEIEVEMAETIEETSIKVQCEVLGPLVEIVSAHINLIINKIYIRISTLNDDLM